MKRFFPVLAAVFAVASLSACTSTQELVTKINPFKIDVRQGNYVSQDMVAQLKPGQTKDQVRFILGTPLVDDIFHADRWDYVYRFQPGRGEVQQRRLIVFFDKDGKLVRVGGDVVAGAAGGTTPAQPPMETLVIPDPNAKAAAADAKTDATQPAEAGKP